MRRGEIWTASGSGYAGKPRPAVILQDEEAFGETESITLCGFTTESAGAPMIRLLVEPSSGNGLRETSFLMVDKILTVPRTKLGRRVGQLDPDDLERVNEAVILFLGLAS